MSDSFATPWTVACQAPLSMGFSRQEYWSGLPFPSPGALPDPGTEPEFPALAGRFFTTEPPGKPTDVYQFSSVVSDSVTPWTATHQASLSIANSRSLIRLMSMESVMPSKHLILCHPLLLLPQSFPASGSFSLSHFFASGGQSIGVSASASVLPMNIKD